MNTCLILVDHQNDYFPGGAMELVGMREAAAKARLLLQRFRQTGSLIIHIQHFSTRPGATFFRPDTEGVRINEMAAPLPDETVVSKNYPNGFRGTPLLEFLTRRNIGDLVICGAMSHMCIDATTRAAFDFGFSCIVAEDACATRDLQFRGTTIRAAEVHASFMAALSVPYARVISTEEILENSL
jgi:nicotinamidase-related amidase